MSHTLDRLTGWGVPVGVFLLALASRLPALGKFLTPDEFLWVDRSRNFLAGLLNAAHMCQSPANHTGLEQAVGLACTLRTGHPGVTTMWTGSLGIVLRYLAEGMPAPLFDYVVSLQTNPLDPGLLVWERLPTVVLVSVWVAAVCLLVGRLFDNWLVAMVVGLLLALDPFHVALSRVIHHDALATAFMTLSMLMALIYWVRGQSRRWLVASGVMAGLAFLSKSTSLFLNPFIVLVGLWALFDRRRRGERVDWRCVMATVGDGLLWFGLAAATFFVCWPAMWVIPLDTLGTVFTVGLKYAGGGHAKGNYFLGTISRDPGPFFYPVIWLLRSSPLVWVGLAAGLYGGLSRWKASRSRERRVVLQPDPNTRRLSWSPILVLMVLYILLFVVFISFGEKKQDRYLLPIWPVVSAVAAVGLVQLLNERTSESANRRIKKPARWDHSTAKLGALVLGGILILQGALIVTNYPYYFTYYNPLLGGIRGAEKMVTIGWGEGMDLAADYLNQKPDAEGLRVSAWYQSTFAPFFDGEAISYSKEKGKALAGDYVVFYINQLQRHFPDDELLRYFQARYREETTIYLKGISYAVIYPGPRIHHYVEDRVDENRRVYRGIAALLGWDWPDAANPDHPSVAAGDTLPFRLYWEYLGKMPEEQFFFRLVGPGGHILAEGTSQPVLSENGDPAVWREGQIITEEGTLPVPTDLSPGDYQLQIGFYTQAPAVTEGELIFDLPPEEAWVRVTPATQSGTVDDPSHKDQSVQLTHVCRAP